MPKTATPGFVAAIDQGTTSTRCMIIDNSGKVIAVDQQEHQQIYPQPGWVEHNPLEIWGRTQGVVRGALARAGPRASEIAAVGVTNQRETTLAWDRNTGMPYYNAIVWQDTRTKAICERLAVEGEQERLRAKVGLPLATYFSGPKVVWLLENIPGLRAAAERGEALFGNIDTWEIWCLTGGSKGGAHIKNVTNASRTMLMNLKILNWDDEILALLSIPCNMLPRILPSNDPNPWGVTLKDRLVGFSIPVCGDLSDQQAALVGQTACRRFIQSCCLLQPTATSRKGR